MLRSIIVEVRRLATYTAVAAILTSVACTEVRSGHPANDSEREAAHGLVAQLLALGAQPDASARILTATDAAPFLALAAAHSIAVPQPPDHSPLVAPADGCFITSATSTTLSQCEFAEHIVDGTWSLVGSRAHAELVDVFVYGPEVHGSVAIESNLAIGNELSGTVDANIILSTANGEFVLDVHVRVDGLLIEGPDCASGGNIAITATSSGAHMDSESGAQKTATSLWFGPGCHDVHIAR